MEQRRPVHVAIATDLVPVDLVEAESTDHIELTAVPIPWSDRAPVIELRADWRRALATCDVLVGFPEQFVDLPGLAPRLRWVLNYGAGFDQVPLELLKRHGIGLVTAAGAGGASVAEFAITAVLCLARRVPERLEAHRQRTWTRFPATDARGRRLLVVGAGEIGSRVARLGEAVGFEVTVARRDEHRPVDGASRVISWREIVGALPSADVVVLCAPLNDATRGLVDAEFLRALPSGALLVNVARGGLVDTEALVDACESGHLGGAWLDVVPVEPLPPESPLWTTANVVISAHDAVSSRSYPTAVLEVLRQRVSEWVAGDPITHAVLAPTPFDG
jgi:D-2-hydroxyacid dehydrogenase (NADP+)